MLGKSYLQIGFTFHADIRRRRQPITRTAAFNGSLAFTDGEIQWTFSATGTTVDLAVGADIKLGPIQLDARLNLPMGGGEVNGVIALLGCQLLALDSAFASHAGCAA